MESKEGRTSSLTQAIFVITGPMAAGKSTVARLLAERFERAVYLEGDFFRRSIVAGRREMTPDESAEAEEQLRLRYRLAAMVADLYFDEGYTVVLEDVVAGRWLAEYAALIRSQPLHVVVLLPSLDTLVAREDARESAGYTHWSIEEFHETFAADTPPIGMWLDTSGQTPEQTVEEIIGRIPSVKPST